MVMRLPVKEKDVGSNPSQATSLSCYGSMHRLERCGAGSTPARLTNTFVLQWQ